MTRRTTKGICPNCKRQSTFDLSWHDPVSKVGSYRPQVGYRKQACCAKCFVSHDLGVEKETVRRA